MQNRRPHRLGARGHRHLVPRPAVAVSGGADATVRVWDLSGQYDQPAEAIRDIELNAVVLGLAEGPDGLVIATTSEGVAALDHRGTPDP